MMIALEAVFGPFETILGPTWTSRGHLGPNLARSWDSWGRGHHGPILGQLGAPKGLLERHEAVLPVLRRPWAPLDIKKYDFSWENVSSL